MKQPHHGDGKIYEGECCCCGVVKRGTVARSRPKPYLDVDILTGEAVRVVLLFTLTGAHDVPVAQLKEVTS